MAAGGDCHAELRVARAVRSESITAPCTNESRGGLVAGEVSAERCSCIKHIAAYTL